MKAGTGPPFIPDALLAAVDLSTLSQMDSAQASLILEGPDARDFLHRLTTADARHLAPGESAPTCFLTAQGKLEAYFVLTCESPTRFRLDVPCTPGKPELTKLKSVIDRYTFAENFQLTEIAIDSGTRSLSASERVEKLVPAPGHELTEDASPLEVGLGGAIAPNKGCYPGQEVIEKVISLGSPARRLVRIEGEGSPAEQAEVLDTSTHMAIGRITTLSPAGGKFRALAIVRKTHAKEGADVLVAPKIHGRITAVAPYQTP